MRQKRKAPWISSSPIYSRIWDLIYIHNRNYLGAYCGGTGNGKSIASIKNAWDLDRAGDLSPRFDVDRIVFLPADFISLVRENMPKGSFIIWDETGVEVNAREFYTWKNKLISYITQTFRYKNLGVLFTVPSMTYVDKQVRQLFHSYTAMHRVNKRAKKSYGTFYWMQYSGRTGKTYYKMPRYYIKDKAHIVDRVNFSLPPKELVEQYEEKKKKTAEKWYEAWDSQLKMVKNTLLEEHSNKNLNLKAIYNELAGQIGLFIDIKTKKVLAEKILMRYDNIPEPKARTLAKMLNLGLEDGSIEC